MLHIKENCSFLSHARRCDVSCEKFILGRSGNCRKILFLSCDISLSLALCCRCGTKEQTPRRRDFPSNSRKVHLFCLFAKIKRRERFEHSSRDTSKDKRRGKSIEMIVESVYDLCSHSAFHSFSEWNFLRHSIASARESKKAMRNCVRAANNREEEERVGKASKKVLLLSAIHFIHSNR